MPITWRAKGALTRTDTGTTGQTVIAIAMPPGVAVNDFLLMTVVTDCQIFPTPPPGWTHLPRADVGSQSGLTPYPVLSIYYRVADGTEGSSESITVSGSPYPAGDPIVLAQAFCWSGTHLTSPIVDHNFTTTTTTAAAHAHPQITTTSDQNWLISVRAISHSAVRSFTISGGTNTERSDESDLIPELSFALYDSNGALSTGLQTQRTTTANGTVNWGGAAYSVALRPPAPTNVVAAAAGVAEGTGTANNAVADAVSGPWLCPATPVYRFMIDWNQDGEYTESSDGSGMLLLALHGGGGGSSSSLEDATDRITSNVVIQYGRDQERQLSPAAIGNASFTVINDDGLYSPENTDSVLHGDLDPAREMKAEVEYNGVTYPLFRGRTDDFNVHVDRSNRSVDFTFLDLTSMLQGVRLSTELYNGLRTGELINTILDLCGWTGPREIDPGATIVAWWWAEGTNALQAIQDLVRSEGPPAIAYVGPDGTFIFHDRHHRLLKDKSLSVQGTYAAKAMDCDAPLVVGLHYTAPFEYSHGWRDIVNSVTFEVEERAPVTSLAVVWTADDSVVLDIGQSTVLEITANDPFFGALTPVLGTDYSTVGAGTVQVSISRTSGQSLKLTMTAIGGSVVVQNLRIRAQSVTVRRTTKVTRTDAGSITAHGERTYPDAAPWAGVNDAYAIAGSVLLQYSQRRPTVQLRLVSEDPELFGKILAARVSDRIRIVNDEMGLAADFFVERINHTIQRFNQTTKPPVHSVVLGCEKVLVFSTNPFTFDKHGAGFDQGTFDPIQSDDPETVFVFDHDVQGQFDVGCFGT